MMAMTDEEKKEMVRGMMLKRFQERRAADDKGVSDAQDQQSWLGVANNLGRSLTDLSNAKQTDAILYNKFSDMAGPQRVIEADKRKWDDEPLDKIGKMAVDRAQGKRKAGFDTLKDEQSVREWERENANAPLEDQFAEDKRGQYRTEWARENKNAPLEDQFEEEKRGFKRYEMGREKKLNAFEDQDIDPNSSVSKNVGLLYKNVLLSKAAEAQKAGDTQAAGELRAMAKSNKMSAREQYNSLKMMNQMDWRDIIDSQDRARLGRMAAPRDINPMVQKASKELASHQNMQEAFGIVDRALGGPLEKYESRNGKVYRDGKEIDLPGVSFKGIGRITAHSEKARQLEAAASRVFNTVLADRSGAAVTNSEMDRLRSEFESGRMNSEADLIRGMQDYKRAAAAAMKNAEAGFSPEVLNTYRGRGGKTLDDYKTKEKGNPGGVPPEAGSAEYDGWEVTIPKRKRVKSIDDL